MDSQTRTLIRLIVVVAILGIVLSLVIPTFLDSRMNRVNRLESLSYPIERAHLAGNEGSGFKRGLNILQYS